MEQICNVRDKARIQDVVCNTQNDSKQLTTMTNSSTCHTLIHRTLQDKLVKEKEKSFVVMMCAIICTVDTDGKT
jgi:hypothetical protein